MPRQTPEEKLAKLKKEDEEREARLKQEKEQRKAEMKQLEARVRLNQKKAYDRKCFILGEIALKHMPKEAIQELVNSNVSDPEVRKLFEV